MRGRLESGMLGVDKNYDCLTSQTVSSLSTSSSRLILQLGQPGVNLGCPFSFLAYPRFNRSPFKRNAQSKIEAIRGRNLDLDVKLTGCSAGLDSYSCLSVDTVTD